jgi:hypothetical protein
MIAGLVLLSIGAAVLWVAKLRPELEAERHRRALERWPDLVRNGFKGETQEVAGIFYACFRSGDEAAQYNSLLATAQRQSDPGGVVLYQWHWDRGHQGEGDALFQVYTKDDPPVIWMVYIAPISR